MRDYTLAQQYALVGLNGLESIHMDMAKKCCNSSNCNGPVFGTFFIGR